MPGKSHGWRSLVGCSPWGYEESDTTERLHFHFSLSCIGEGNGNPLQCSCLENPRDRAAEVYGVAQSRKRLKQLSSSSSSNSHPGSMVAFLITLRLFRYLYFFALVVVYSLSHSWLFCDPMDCSLLGPAVHVISQARVLEWVAIAFSRGSLGHRV